MNGPLQGIRVIDMTTFAAGPYCTTMLGNLGAEVIKIERPGTGDPIRYNGKLIAPDACSLFLGLNQSKKSITLEMKTPGGAQILKKLVESSDVFITNLRPKVVESAGLTYETLAEINPRIVYCFLTAFGETGPWKDKPGMDPIVQALGGTMGLTGEPGKKPIKIGPAIGDFEGSFLAFGGIVAALYAREKLGFGQKVSVNLLDGQLAMLTNYMPGYLINGQYTEPFGSGHPDIVPYDVFKTQDIYIVVACLGDHFYRSMCQAIGLPHLADDPRFKTNNLRVQHRNEFLPLLEEHFMRFPSKELLGKLDAADVPCAPVNTFKTLFDEPQVHENKMYVEVEHPQAGKIPVMGIPIKFSKTPGEVWRAAPSIGQDNEEVLQALGYSTQEIEGLRVAGVI